MREHDPDAPPSTDPDDLRVVTLQIPPEQMHADAVLLITCYIEAREKIGQDIGPRAFVFMGLAEDGQAVIMPIQVPEPSTIRATAGKLWWLVVSQCWHLDGHSSSQLAAAQAYRRMVGSLEGFPGAERRVVGILYGSPAWLWGCPMLEDGTFRRPTVDDTTGVATIEATAAVVPTTAQA